MANCMKVLCCASEEKNRVLVTDLGEKEFKASTRVRRISSGHYRGIYAGKQCPSFRTIGPYRQARTWISLLSCAFCLKESLAALQPCSFFQIVQQRILGDAETEDGIDKAPIEAAAGIFNVPRNHRPVLWEF